MELPCSAASIMTPMMLRPFTTWPSFATVTSASNAFAVSTNSFAARACRPRRFRISRLARWASVLSPAIGVFVVPGDRRRGPGCRRPEDVLLAVPLDEARERAGVHLVARRRELDQDRHVRSRHDLGSGLTGDGEALIGRRVAQH